MFSYKRTSLSFLNCSSGFTHLPAHLLFNQKALAADSLGFSRCLIEFAEMLTARRLGGNWHPRRLQAPRNPAHAAAVAGPAGHLKVLFTEFTGNFLSEWQPLDLQSTTDDHKH